MTCRIFTTLILFSLSVLSSWAQQPVQITTLLRPPYSLQLSDYYTSTQEKLVVTLTNRDLNKPVLNVRLRLTIESQGVKLRSRDFASLPTLPLEAGVPLRLSLGDLAPYFNAENLDFAGITRAQYAQQPRLPEGFYQFCFEAIEVSTGQTASAKSCAMAWMSLSDPPFLNLPRKEEAIAFKEPQNIIFQWTPRHLNSPNSAYQTEYDFQLAELWDTTLAPEVAFQTTQPLYEVTTRTTTLLYGPAQPLLIAGKRYAWRVRARARSGVEDVDVFRNQGYSEIYSFTYQDICQPPTGIAAAPGTFGNLEFSWTAASRHTGYMVTYRQKDVAGATWFDRQSSAAPALVYDVQPGIEYEYRIGAFCGTGQPVFSALHTVTLPARETESFVNCSLVPDPQITNRQVLQMLQPGDVITAGNFPVKVDQVTGSGSFTGKGYVTVPFLGRARVRVKFQGIQVNTQKQLIAGTVITTYDEAEGSIIDVDEGLDIFKDYQGIVSRLKDFDADSDIEDLKKILDKLTEHADQELPEDEVKKVKENIAELLEAKTAYDQIKTVYDALPDGDPLKEEMKKNLDEARDKFDEIKSRFESIDENAITTERYSIMFARSGRQPLYGFDSLKYRPHLESNYDFVRNERGTFFVPWKSVPQGDYDWANIYPRTPGDTLPERIVFRSSTGTLTSNKLHARAAEVKLFGYAPGEKNTVVAYEQRTVGEKEVNVEIGKINVVSYEKLYRKLVLVPVNDARVVASRKDIQEELNIIYRQAVVEWTVEVQPPLSSTYDVDNNGLDDDFRNLSFSSYTEEMKYLINDYAAREPFLEDVHYLFILAKSESGEHGGYNPYNRQAGFIFLDGDYFDEASSLARVAAHEIGHGAFQMRHSFENTSIPRGTSDNLMDYNAGTTLYKHQWDQIHDPAIMLSLFDNGENAAYKSWTFLEGDVIPDITAFKDKPKSFLSLTGEIITLPEAAGDFAFFNGYLAAFTIRGEENGRYTALSVMDADKRSGVFKGYFKDAKKMTSGGFNTQESTPYQGIPLTRGNDDIEVIYALSATGDCGAYEISTAVYLPDVNNKTDGGINDKLVYNNSPITSTPVLRDHLHLESATAGINCLKGRAKELYKFIEDHFASHQVTLTDAYKKELIGYLRIFNTVHIKDLDGQDPGEEAGDVQGIRMREMLNYGHTNFLAKLKETAEKALLKSVTQKQVLVVEFEDYERFRDLYLIYVLKTSSCQYAEHMRDLIKEQIGRAGEIQFNLVFFGVALKTLYETPLNEPLEALACLLTEMKMAESFYNPNRFDYDPGKFEVDVMEWRMTAARSLINGLTGHDILSPVAALEVPAQYLTACSCGAWNSLVDVFSESFAFGASVTQSPDEIIKGIKELWPYVSSPVDGIQSVSSSIWSVLKEHHGYVEGHGADSYQATYSACYDAVVLATILRMPTKIPAILKAIQAGDLKGATSLAYIAARSYPGDVARAVKDLARLLISVKDPKTRKIVLEILINLKDRVQYVVDDTRNAIILLSEINRAEIFAVTPDGIRIPVQPGDAKTRNLIYQSGDDVTDGSNNDKGKLTLQEDEEKNIKASVGPARGADVVDIISEEEIIARGLPTRTLPGLQPDINARPTGTPKAITGNDENRRALIGENQIAVRMSQRGYKVRHLEEKPDRKNPDYAIEGRIFDGYYPHPNTVNVTTIRTTIIDKITKKQTQRIAIKIDKPDKTLLDALKENLVSKPIDGLREIIIDTDAGAVHFYPFDDHQFTKFKTTTDDLSNGVLLNFINVNNDRFAHLSRSTEGNSLVYTFEVEPPNNSIPPLILRLALHDKTLRLDFNIDERLRGTGVGYAIFNDAVGYLISNYATEFRTIIINCRDKASAPGEIWNALNAIKRSLEAKDSPAARNTLVGNRAAVDGFVNLNITDEAALSIKMTRNSLSAEQLAGLTTPSRSPDAQARPAGEKNELYKVQNATAEVLARKGYDIAYNNATIVVEGKKFSCYSPETQSISTIYQNLYKRVNDNGQERIVVSLLHKNTVTFKELSDNLPDNKDKLEGAKEILVIDKDGQVVHLLPVEARNLDKKNPDPGPKPSLPVTNFVDGYDLHDENGQLFGKLYREPVEGRPDALQYTVRFNDPAKPAISQRISLRGGVLDFDELGSVRSVKAKDMLGPLLDDVVEFFGKDRIESVSDLWDEVLESHDMATYKEALESMNPRDAAFSSVLGMLAKRIGLTRVHFLGVDPDISPNARRIAVDFKKQGTLVDVPRDAKNNIIGSLYREPIQGDKTKDGLTIVYYFESPDYDIVINTLHFALSGSNQLNGTLTLEKVKQSGIGTTLFQDAKRQFNDMGKEILSFKGLWTHKEGLNDNYRIYKELRKTMSKEDAARGTPTGKIMAKVFGFTNVEVFEEDLFSVTAIFKE